MSRRYLFGPVTAAFADQNLWAAREAGECLAFDSTGRSGLKIGPEDTWETVRRGFPSGWEPDFIVLYLPYTQIPSCLWSAPVPIIGLAADFNLLWHWYRHCLPRCDLVLADAAAVEVMEREGMRHGRRAILFGCEQELVRGQGSGDRGQELGAGDEGGGARGPGNESGKEGGSGPRDVDVLFVGNLSAPVQRERLAWLERVAGLSYRWRVAVQTGVYGGEYHKLLRRARIVFNRSIRGEANRRTFEALAAGALLFQEAENREVPALLQDRRECVYYNQENLEELLERYLENEEERRTIAEAGRQRAHEFSFERFWEGQLAEIDREWPAIVERSRCRPVPRRIDDLIGRSWQALGGPSDPGLASDLAGALVEQPLAGCLHNALGLAAALEAARQGKDGAKVAQQAAGYFERAVACEPSDVLAHLNWVEALYQGGQTRRASEEAHRALDALDKSQALPAASLEGGHFPPAFDAFRVECERAAWTNAGNPQGEAGAKRDLLRWRLACLLGDTTGEPKDYYEAVLSRPDLAVSRAALGCALARTRDLPRAVPHLRRALAENPFDLPAARALFQALGDQGDGTGQRRLADRRRLFSGAAGGVVPMEPWIARTPPAGDELVSIVILACNQKDVTRMCLDSVIRHTRRPYELLLVDNGSTDGTGEMFEEMQTGRSSDPHPNPSPGVPGEGPARVVVVRNERNLGFGKGCNQALAKARGRYIVFLNNDTIVTGGWLSRLVHWSLRDWPKIGLVGPMTNGAPPPQYAQPDYKDVSGLEEFAERWRNKHAGKALATERLTGFCLLARREVLNKIGGFDERFGLGFFEDDDLGFRAQDGGFGLLVAQDVYIHHFGNRTVRSLGIDAEQQLRRNLRVFKDKWGPERAAGYRFPRASTPSPLSKGAGRPRGSADAKQSFAEGRSQTEFGNEVDTSPSVGGEIGTSAGRNGRPTVSLCLIVRNEEKNLPGCLDSVADLADEIVVVDTGSTDATKEIAERFKSRVFDFAWVDNFAAARNESLRHATGDWIFWMDADDRVDAENRSKLRELFAKLGMENAGYVMKCRCLPQAGANGAATVVDHLRLFRNLPGLNWSYRVHEQIVPSLRAQNVALRTSEVVISHVGYRDPALRGRKQERDLRLLHLDHGDDPHEPFTLFNLGWNYLSAGKADVALPYLRESLERCEPSASIVRKLYPLLMDCHLKLGQRDEALAVCREGRKHFPHDEQLLHQEASVRQSEGDLAAAEKLLLELIGTEEPAHFASVTEGLRGYKARHELASIYMVQGRIPEAEAQWRAALAESPAFGPSCVGLAKLYLQHERPTEAEEVVGRWEAVDSQAVREAGEVWAIRAQSCLVRKDPGRARSVLEEAVKCRSGDAGLWKWLGRANLLAGGDRGRAIEALGRTLELVPNDVEARDELARVLLG